MGQSRTEWPANRYRRRLAYRLRRRNYHRKSDGAAHHHSPGAETAAAADQSAELQAAADKLKDQLLRLQAEFENFRRRSRKEVEDVKTVANANTLEKLLPVIDNFTRALKTPATSVEGFVDGVKMIHGHFMNLLKDAGLEPIDAAGKPFDPNFHEAVAVDTSGEHPENHVVEVLQDGYAVKGKLIRPAIVRVARKE